MYNIVYTNRMKKDVKRAIKRGKNLSKLAYVLDLLQIGDPLPENYKDHALSGD